MCSPLLVVTPLSKFHSQLDSGYHCKRSSSCESEMEKPMAVTNEKVSNYIPTDLAFSILSKLPIKSLKRFGCLCKSWALLFENPNFMSLYRKNFISNDRSYSDETSLLLHHYHKRQNVLYTLFGERFENRVKLDWPNLNLFQEGNDFDIFGYGGINGILCLHQLNERVVLWNPATQEFKVSPSDPVESTVNLNAAVHLYGFGYDRVRDDYKVIRHVALFPNADSVTDDVSFGCIPLDSFWEVYSLRSNFGRKLDVDMPDSYDTRGVYMDGMCHWLCENKQVSQAYLVSFDLSNEVFFTTPIPSYIHDIFAVGLAWEHLVVLNESIALISYHKQTTTFHISILGELGVKESWTKLVIVGPLPCVDRPIGVGKNGEIFFRRKDKELAWFDLSTQMIEELGLKAARFGCQIGIYKENLLSIGRTNN